MRKLYLLLLSATLFTACVDKDYDLGDVDTDHVAIGEEGSEFKIPLARVLVTTAEINSGDVNIRDLVGKADKWLPTTLPGSAAYVDLTQLDDDAYTDGLFDALVAEMQTSPAKLNLITDLIWEDYEEAFASILGVSTGNEAAFKTTFKALYATDERVLAEIKAQFSGYLADDMRVEPLDYTVNHIDIGSDVVDMLADNLDPRGQGDKNTLHLYGEITSALPVSLGLDPQFTPTEVTFHVDVEADRPESVIPRTRLYADDLRQIVDGIDIHIPVTLEKYFPGKGFQDNLEHQIVIDLRLVKTGGLKLDL